MLQLAVDNKRDPRAYGRSNVFLTAALDSSGATWPVRLRNISARGALLEGTKLPPEGSSVRLRRGSLAADGEVVWQNCDHRGIRFSGPVDVPEWVKRVEHVGQLRVDQQIAAVRAAQHLQKVAQGDDALIALSADLDGACEELASLPCRDLEFGELLVRIDTIAQRLRELIARQS